MSALVWLVALVAGPSAGSTADRVNLRDGAVVLGQVVDPNDRGKLILVVRRAWAESELPARAKAWRDAEAPWLKRARAERLARLEGWARERRAARTAAQAVRDDLLDWLDAEADRLRGLGPEDDLPPLMMAALERREVKSVDRRPPEQARLLRLGWRAGFADVETMAADDLKSALEGRNFPVAGDDPAAIDDLMPTPIETEARWRSRRAATEVEHDEGGRFVRFQGLVLPEGTPGEAVDAGPLVSGLLGSILGEAPAEDPLASHLRALAAKGRVGAVVTSLDLTPDLSGARVEVTLLVRLGRDDWRPAVTRSAAVRADQLAPDAGANIPGDPQVKPLFDLVEGLGLPGYSARMKGVGAATQQALGRARTEFQSDLDALALPAGESRR